MILEFDRRKWTALSVVGFGAAIFSPIWADWIGFAEAANTGGPIYGILMGGSCFALSNSFAKRPNAQRTPDLKRLSMWAGFSLAISLFLIWLMAARAGLVQGATVANSVDLFLGGTILVLSLVVPTPAQGLLLPAGDERFRANQLYAQSQTLRLTLASSIAVIAFTDYGVLSLPLTLILAAIASGMGAFYCCLLLLLEWREEM